METIVVNKKRRRKKDNKAWENFTITIKERSVKQKYSYEPIEKRHSNSYEDLINGEPLGEIIKKNNIDSEINYYYLKNVKSINKLDYLEEALNKDNYLKLYKNKVRENPFDLILIFLDNIINNKNNDKILSGIKFMGYNLPLIFGIERIRLNYYLWLFKKKDLKYRHIFASDLKNLSYFFDYLKQLNKDDECEKKNINIMFYQFILDLTEVIYPENSYVNNIITSYNKINPNFIEFRDKRKNTLIGSNVSKKDIFYLKKIDNNNYLVSNGRETNEIKEKDYNLETLSEDIKYYHYYPLDLLLYKNESIPFYYKENKTFIERKSGKLFESFKNYFYDFIASKNFMDILSKQRYINAKEFLSSKNIKNILFNEKYLKFIPFYSKKYSGFTNKDILISVISSYPSLVNNLPIDIEEIHYKDIDNFCFLMSIAEKFVILLHEHALHFVYGYLYHLAGIDGINNHFFEEELYGQKITSLSITNVITLLDGESIKQSNKQFKIFFNSDFDKKILIDKINKCSGFLRNFLDIFSIDFDMIFNLYDNLGNAYISIKGERLPFIKINNNFNKDTTCFLPFSNENEE